MAAKKAALGLWLPLALLGVWELLTTLRVLDPLFFPAPSTLTTTAGQMLRHGDLIDQVRSTLGRMLIGFLAGSAAGLVCGLLMGGISAIGRSLEPLISAVYATPNLTLLPMLMLFFGVGDTAGLILIATGCFLLVTVHALDAVRRVNHHYIEMAANYGADRLAIFRRVYFPACLPGIATGIRRARGRAW